jgi:hypothetical protein
MVTKVAKPAEQAVGRETRWNFGEARRSLDEFLAQKEAAGFEFFAGKEPWLVGIEKLTLQTFFRVCTEEMDDLSQRAVKLLIEYCLEIALADNLEKQVGSALIYGQIPNLIHKCCAQHFWINVEYSKMWSCELGCWTTEIRGGPSLHIIDAGFRAFPAK